MLLHTPPASNPHTAHTPAWGLTQTRGCIDNPDACPLCYSRVLPQSASKLAASSLPEGAFSRPLQQVGASSKARTSSSNPWLPPGGRSPADNRCRPQATEGERGRCCYDQPHRIRPLPPPATSNPHTARTHAWGLTQTRRCVGDTDTCPLCYSRVLPQSASKLAASSLPEGAFPRPLQQVGASNRMGTSSGNPWLPPGGSCRPQATEGACASSCCGLLHRIRPRSPPATSNPHTAHTPAWGLTQTRRCVDDTDMLH